MKSSVTSNDIFKMLFPYNNRSLRIDKYNGKGHADRKNVIWTMHCSVKVCTWSNKPEHAVHSYAAIKDWIYCETKYV